MNAKNNWFFLVVTGTALLLGACKKDPSGAISSNSVSSDAKNSALAKVKVFATGLNNPRGLKFGPDGMLYVAEGGIGGKDSTTGMCDQVPFPVGPYKGSPTGGRISKISATGERTTVTDQLPSSQASPIVGSDVEGVSDVAFIGNTLYALLAGAGCSHGVANMPNGVVKVSPDGKYQLIADYSAFVKSHPSKVTEEDDFEPDETPFNMIYQKGCFYVTGPNHGSLDEISPNGSITRVVDISASQGHIVPTALAWCGSDFYVGNLNTFPIVEGSSKILKISTKGKVEVWQTGFTTILGLVFDKLNRLYVLETTSVSGPIPTPNTGRIIRINLDGSRDIIATDLNVPTGITIGPDGKLYVSNVGFGPTAIGGGQILQIEVENPALAATIK